VKRWKLLWTLLAGLGSTAVDAAQPSLPAPPWDLPAFVLTLENLRQEATIPGLSYAVVRDGELLAAGGLGLADVASGRPATADTPYDIASVAKPLSAVVAMHLVETGQIDLDRPLSEYSDWAAFCTGFSRQPTPLASGLDCSASSHSLRHLLSHTANSTPGTHFSYNPVLYSWASRPMMTVTDQRFSDLVGQWVFAPAGMDHSARKYRDLPLRDDLATTLATPYRIDASSAAAPAPPGRPQGDGAAGGVVSTVLDLARFDIAFDRGVLVSPSSREDMLTPTRDVHGNPLSCGLGWFIQTYQGERLAWHSGWWENAWSALYLKLPDRDLSFIVLANSEGLWWNNPPERAEVERSQFAHAFLKAFLPD